MTKLRKAHCSPLLVCEDNLMVFISHSVPFPATRDQSWLEMAPRESQKPFHFPHTSDGKQILISQLFQLNAGKILYFLLAKLMFSTIVSPVTFSVQPTPDPIQRLATKGMWTRTSGISSMVFFTAVTFC